VPIAATPDQLALQASLRDWARQAAPLAAVRRLEPGAPAQAENSYLSDLADLGLSSIAAWDAARAADEAPAEHPLAAALALDDAVENAKDCIQVLGGTGFTREHDAHLYLRRALALRALLGGSAPRRIRTAGLAAAAARRRGEFLLTRCLSIAGGTTQILLDQVGERVLGLPR
jgi:alkylation response protein AidB-like acyl-CoA dehydrogenase